MYSPVSKYLSLIAAIFFLLLAGMALAGHGLGRGLVVCLLLGVAFVMAFAYECGQQGAQPLTALKPKREYRVEAVLDNVFGIKRRKVRMVVSWHVDYGHYEFRLADIERDRLEHDPVVGDTLVGRRMEYEGGMFYNVQSAPVSYATRTIDASA